MAEPIEKHQLWRSRDKRDHGRTVYVTRVIPLMSQVSLGEPKRGSLEAAIQRTGGGHVVVLGNQQRQSTMTFKTLRTRYERVH